MLWIGISLVAAYLLGAVHGATFLRDWIERKRRPRVRVPLARASYRHLDEPACKRRQLIARVLS